jgi:hypothetical protein
MKVLLIDRGCWEFITGETEAVPDDAPASEKSSFKRRKARAYTTIYQGVERQFQSLIADTTDGKVAWDTLKKNFEPTSRARLAGLVDEFYELKFNPVDETIGIFCKRIREKQALIEEAGFKIPDILVCFQLIRKLPPEYDNIVQILYRLEDKNFTITNIETQLISESGRIHQKKKDEGVDIISDAYISNHSREKKPTGSGAVLDRKERSFQRVKCDYCKKLGHSSNKCYKRLNHKFPERTLMQNGKYNVFYSEVCRKPKNTCFEALQTSEVRPNVKFSNLHEWLIDSAATSHFCNERSWFENFRSLSCSKVLTGDKNSESEVRGIGDITFYIKDVKGFVELKMINVLFAPNMRRNLIGGANIDMAGFKVNWGNNKMVIRKCNGDYFFTVNRVNKLYIVYGIPKIEYENAYFSGLNIELVHRRFGHVNVPLLKSMSSKNLVKGIEKVKGNLDSCDICKISKSTKISHKQNYGITKKSALERVYMDLWGPSPVQSVGGSKYFLSVIDDYSRKVDVYTIKNKSEVFSCFKRYVAKVERELGRKVKCIRTDNGLEFCHKEFEKYLVNLGIKMERTSTYSPQQNGVAERFNRTAIEGVRAMLQDSGLKPSFWAEALHAYVHIRNRCENKLHSKTPIERWKGYKPSVRHFRIFGSLAYAHIPGVKRNKLEPKAQLGIMVGYAVKTKGYRIWLPKDRKVIETIHVNINENKNGVQSLYGKRSVCKFKLDDIPDNETENKLPDIKQIDLTKWKRVERPRTKSSRIDVYYYTPLGKRLRSLNDIRKYCESEGFEYKPEMFKFKPETLVENKDVETPLNDNISNDSSEDAESNAENNMGIENLIDYMDHEVYNIEIPKTYEQSQVSPYQLEWNKAMVDELQTMRERKVWTLVDRPEKTKVVGSRWVYSVKTNDNKQIVRFKARLVAQGYKQRKYIDYTDIFSPVVNFSVIKLLVVLLISILGWYHEQADVKAAYLYGNLNEVIYMEQPPGFQIKGKENKVCLLKKSIYGLHQSGREWHIELNKILELLEFEKLKWCNCVYKYKSNIVLVVYVDDLVIFGKSPNDIDEVFVKLNSELDIKRLGKIKHLLGVNFENINSCIYMHQISYIEKLVERFNDLPKSNVSLPLKIGCVLPSKVKEDEISENDLMLKFPYRTLIGCLSYLADRTRPDISFAVNVMSQYCNGYTFQHWKIVVDLMNYVFNTKYYTINLSKISGLRLEAFADANWGSNLMTRHSTTGYIILFGNVPFAWKASKQKCIALSSMESEFVALANCSKELTWFHNVINELNLIKIDIPIQWSDNQSAIFFSTNRVENLKTKHIDIKYQFIRELVTNNKIVLNYVKSKDNLADFLTRTLSKDSLKKFIHVLFEVKDVQQGSMGPSVG